ncbi:serine/threonine-protein kinase [Streptomyces chartreusis]|uniref:serine/threonine-protein kinase n=1 Tax=Streptomyces chartreusis TaxID=1969 RepID=UPI00367FB6B5
MEKVVQMFGSTVGEGKRELPPGYDYVRDLGSGATGQVLCATHRSSQTPVAVKLLSPDLLSETASLERFRAEARILGRLSHPNIATLYEYVETQAYAAIVMELVAGASLRTLLNDDPAVPPVAALAMLKGSLLALMTAHENGIIHRDYKPGNVMVTHLGESKLVDFGIAVALRSEGVHLSGTPAYMAPELWLGSPATAASDIYAATATFFECLTGTKPFSGNTIAELVVQHASAAVPVERAPGYLRDLIGQGLAKEPVDRPRNIRQFIRELESIAGAAHGKDWEEHGREALAAMAALLASRIADGPTQPDLSHSTTDLATTTLHTRRRGTASSRRGGSARTGIKQSIIGGGIAVVVLGSLAAAIAVSDNHPPASGDHHSAETFESDTSSKPSPENSHLPQPQAPTRYTQATPSSSAVTAGRSPSAGDVPADDGSVQKPDQPGDTVNSISPVVSAPAQQPTPSPPPTAAVTISPSTVMSPSASPTPTLPPIPNFPTPHGTSSSPTSAPSPATEVLAKVTDMRSIGHATVNASVTINSKSIHAIDLDFVWYYIPAGKLRSVVPTLDGSETLKLEGGREYDVSTNRHFPAEGCSYVLMVRVKGAGSAVLASRTISGKECTAGNGRMIDGTAK